MEEGFVLNFSNASFQQFIYNVCKIDIYNSKYDIFGNSKANRLRAFWQIESDKTVGILINEMLAYWRTNRKINAIEINYKTSAPTFRSGLNNNFKKMKMFFDSNVWQIVTLPFEFPDEPLIADFFKINQAIKDKKIEPFLSETIFTIEAIRKIERKEVFSSTSLKCNSEEKETESGEIVQNFTFGPDEKDAISLTDKPILKKYFDEAIKLGFRIVRFPRIGGLVNPEVETIIKKVE